MDLGVSGIGIGDGVGWLGRLCWRVEGGHKCWRGTGLCLSLAGKREEEEEELTLGLFY